MSNAYCLIALIETIAKVQSTIVTEDLSYECERFGLLPDLQFGSRPGRSTTDALPVKQYIKNAWWKNKVVSALFLDIQAAFPNMQKDRLIANMKARNIAKGYCDYVEMILTQRAIQLRFDDHTSRPFLPSNGCCQGCPLSMLLYVIYNAPLINIADPDNPNECIVGFVDDTTLLARGKDFEAAHSTIRDMMERTDGVFEWSNMFNSLLKMSKLALVNFTQSAAKAGETTDLVLAQNRQDWVHVHRIKASQEAKLLGVLLNSRLSWGAQHERVREKAVKWTAAFKRFTRPLAGICMREAAKLYNTVAVPRICYAADLWYTPVRSLKADMLHAGPVGITKHLKSLQRQAAISITGAMRTAPGNATIVHANLIPISLQLRDYSNRAYLCLASRPDSHLISKPILRACKQQVKRHRTTLHHLAKISGIAPSDLEKIKPRQHRLGAPTLFTTQIADSKDQAAELDSDDFNRGLRVYTDGSGQHGVIGAAAVLFIDGVKRGELRYQLGTKRQHTVFEGELIAIQLGLHLVREYIDEYPDVTMCIDSQAAIKSIKNGQAQLVQYIIEEIRHIIKQLFGARQKGRRLNWFINRRTSLSLTWVAGHVGSIGNKAADELAKVATKFGSSDEDLLPDFLKGTLPGSMAASKQHVKCITGISTEKWWKRSKRYRRIRAVDPTLPSKTYITATSNLSHAQTSILTQLCTGHVPLNQHLHRIGKRDSPYCQHCLAMIEDVRHLLLFCKGYTIQRHQLTMILKWKANEISHLLANPKAIRHTLNFLHSTRRFEYIYGDISTDLGD